MTLLELMERVGSRETNKIIAFLKDAFLEMESILEEKMTSEKLDIEEGTRYYNLPANLISLKEVYMKYDDNDKYVKCPRILSVDITEDASSSTASTIDDIIVI